MKLSILGLCLSLLFIAVPAWCFVTLRVKTLRTMLLSLVRMLMQVALVGLLYFGVSAAQSGVLSVLAVLLLTFFSTLYIVRRARLRRRMLLPVWGSLSVVVVAVTLFVLALVVRVDNLLDARWLLPMAGVVLALSVEGCSVALREYFVGLVRFSSTYFYYIGNGKSWLGAVQPMLKRAFERSCLPAARRMAVMGLFVFPLFLGGLCIGGMEIWQAAVLTVLTEVAAFCTYVLVVMLVVVVAQRFVISKRGKLTDTVRLKSNKKAPQVDEGQNL